MARTASTQAGPQAIDRLPASIDGTASAAPPDEDLSFDDLPPFPDDVPTAPLLRINLQRLVDDDTEELDRLWRACCDIGFFYLDLRGATSTRTTDDKASSLQNSANEDPTAESVIEDGAIDGDGLLDDSAALFTLGAAFFALPSATKARYDFRARGSYFGYKGVGAGVVDARGTPDRNEFYNAAKDFLLALRPPLPEPDLLTEPRARARLARFVRRSHAVVSLLLAALDVRLGLPKGTLGRLHRLRARSGDQVRWVSAPPREVGDARANALGEHTDFGSVTVLFNRLGGLQVLPPSSTTWAYVRPLRGHCVVNLGDALVKFSAGVLRSNLHRVVDAPGAQAGRTRTSLVYFARPEDDVVLRALGEGSEVIARAKREAVAKGEADEEEGVRAEDWILRRALGRRAGGDWEKSGGTERR